MSLCGSVSVLYGFNSSCSDSNHLVFYIYLTDCQDIALEKLSVAVSWRLEWMVLIQTDLEYSSASFKELIQSGSLQSKVKTWKSLVLLGYANWGWKSMQMSFLGHNVPRKASLSPPHFSLPFSSIPRQTDLSAVPIRWGEWRHIQIPSINWRAPEFQAHLYNYGYLVGLQI